MSKNKPKLGKKSKRGRPPKHGGYSLLTKGELPENRKYVRNYLTFVREGLIRDLGPKEEDLTTAQLVLIDRVIAKLGVLRLVEEHAKERGIFEDRSLSPSLKESYIAYDNSIRLSLQALGIGRKSSDETFSLNRYLELKKEEKEAEIRNNDEYS